MDLLEDSAVNQSQWAVNPPRNRIYFLIALASALVLLLLLGSYGYCVYQMKDPDPERRQLAAEVPGCAWIARQLEIAPPEGLYVQFYDSTRPNPYALDENRQFATRQQALAALAQDYGTQRAWVEKQAGDSNDLEVIHRRLASAMKQIPGQSGRSTEPDARKGIEDIKRAQVAQALAGTRPGGLLANPDAHINRAQRVAEKNLEYNRQAMERAEGQADELRNEGPPSH